MGQSLDNDLLKVIKGRVVDLNEYENLKVLRGELEVENADPKAFIEKEQLLAKKKQLDVIQMKQGISLQKDVEMKILTDPHTTAPNISPSRKDENKALKPRIAVI